MTQNSGYYVAPSDDTELVVSDRCLSPSTKYDSPKGTLDFLKTTLEVRKADDLIDVYITRVPVKAAHTVLSALRSAGLDGDGLNIQHLRRFAKDEHLPPHLRKPEDHNGPSDLCLLVGPVSVIPLPRLQEFLAKHIPDGSTIDTTGVPPQAPTSEEEATRWSKAYWPVVYKKSNPFGPHPSIITRAELEFSDVDSWMELAYTTTRKTKAAGCGEAIGAVVVHRQDGKASLVAAAGDGRWWKAPSTQGPGNIMGHAAMRAIGMVARTMKTREDVQKGIAVQDPPPPCDDMFFDMPLVEGEENNDVEEFFGKPEGYLCQNLELYMTHEPCIMCSMAIVHSRFGRVVFGQSMPKTGGLTSDGDGVDPGLGHGLFWRKELNWCLLAWRWKREDSAEQHHVVVGNTIHV